MNHKSRNNITFRYINTYFLSYLFGNLSKKILMFSIIVYLARTIDHSSIITFVVFYLTYMSVYFLNDYIDRHLDINRKCIHPYKLVFRRDHLLILGILHLLAFTIVLFILDYKVAVLSFVVVLFGILRSYIRDKTLREISLGILQFLQFCLFFYIIGKPECIVKNIILLLQFSLIYMFLYYIHKIPDNGECRRKSLVYVVVISVLSILALVEVRDLILLVYLVVSLIFVFLAYELFTKQVGKESYTGIMRVSSVIYHILSLVLILFVVYGYFPEIPEYIFLCR